MTIETNVVPLRVVDGGVEMIDQRLLPLEETWHRYESAEGVASAIRDMVIRGAPAIGIAAAFGVAIGVRDWGTREVLNQQREALFEMLANTRPTAVNLFWALDRMRGVIDSLEDDLPPAQIAKRLLAEAVAIHEADRAQCAAIGRHGAELLAGLGSGAGIITHCNTGMLATGGDGTALAVLFTLHDDGKKPRVYADETRPLLQGSRLTAWELMQRGVDVTLICDSMAAPLLRDGEAQAVIVGADRITARGDVADKIGTYGLAVQAKHHGVPFYVAAPTTTFDLTLQSGADIPIEQRAAEEITEPYGKRTAPEDVPVWNPAFDVTPAELIAGIVTERGVISPVNEERVRGMATP